MLDMKEFLKFWSGYIPGSNYCDGGFPAWLNVLPMNFPALLAKKLHPIDIVMLAACGQEGKVFARVAAPRPQTCTLEIMEDNDRILPKIVITITFSNSPSLIWQLPFRGFSSKVDTVRMNILGMSIATARSVDENGQPCLESQIGRFERLVHLTGWLKSVFRTDLTSIKFAGDSVASWDKFHLWDQVQKVPDLYIELVPDYHTISEILKRRAVNEKITRFENFYIKNGQQIDGTTLQFVIGKTICIGANDLGVTEIAAVAERHYNVDTDPLKALTLGVCHFDDQMFRELCDRLKLVQFKHVENLHYTAPRAIRFDLNNLSELYFRGSHVPGETNGTNWVFQLFRNSNDEPMRFEMVRWQYNSRIEEEKRRTRSAGDGTRQ